MRVSFSYKNYPNSKGATVLSTLGGFLKAVGIPLILLFGMGIIFTGIGFGMQKLADVMNENKCFKLWMNGLQQKGVLSQIPYNTELAVKLYEANPTKKTLKYLQGANPQAAMIVQSKGTTGNVAAPPTAPQPRVPATHNMDREKYEALYKQNGSALLQQEYAARTVPVVQTELERIISNTDTIAQQNDRSLLIIYAYLTGTPQSMDPKVAIIKAEYTYRLLRSRNCDGYNTSTTPAQDAAEKWKSQW